MLKPPSILVSVNANFDERKKYAERVEKTLEKSWRRLCSVEEHGTGGGRGLGEKIFKVVNLANAG